jgi:predicted nucleic acid-binding protein
MEREVQLCVTVQNIAEFWNAATRQAGNNGLGFTIEEAQEELTKLEGFFEILNESAASYAAWKTLLLSHRVSGVQVHDARLVAVMQAHGLTSILTFDAGFSRFSGIEIVHPADVEPVDAGATDVAVEVRGSASEESEVRGEAEEVPPNDSRSGES